MTMNCKLAQANMLAYMDGRIESRTRREMGTHLDGCPACRARIAQLRAVWGALDELPAVPPSPGFDAAVRSRIAHEPRRSSVWNWLLVPSPRFAVGVAALLMFSIWLSSWPRPAQPLVSASAVAPAEAEFGMISDLPVLEDYDVLSDFDALSELSAQLSEPRPVPGL